MANIPLQSITFPGLADKYTTPVVDNTLTQAGAAADAKKTGDEIGAIKNDLNQFPNGTYPNMSVGNADQLTATVGIEDNTPYLFRTSGGSNDIGDREDVRKIVGGTVVNNQLAPELKANNNWNNYNIISTVTFDNGVATVTSDTATADMSNGATVLIAGHKYLFVTDALIPNNSASALLRIMHTTIDVLILYDKNVYAEGVWKRTELLYSNTSSEGSGRVTYQGPSGTSFKNVQVFDLTKDFGTAIADYVYSLETATAGAGVGWLKKHFPKQFDAGYQAYDAGSLQSVSGLTEHKMVGFNQWDEEWEVGYISVSDGQPVDGGGHIRSKNFNRCVSNTAYYYKGNNNRYVFWYDADENFIEYNYRNSSDTATIMSPANASYFKVRVEDDTNTYNHDICINLSWDGERDGEYEPYVEYTYPLDDSLTLRGIPKLDSNNQLYYDGDEYLPDGTVNRRYGLVDLGTLNWTKESGHFYSEQVSGFKIISSGTQPDFVCAKYISASYVTVVADSTDKVIGMSNTPRIYVYDSSYTDAATFKTAMSGVYLVYELKTPTTETADPYQETQIVDDFGTEEFILADGAFPVPVGHETYYKNNLRAKLEMSPDSPDGDGLYVVQQTSGQNEYVPLASTSTIQDILTRLTALENENA